MNTQFDYTLSKYRFQQFITNPYREMNDKAKNVTENKMIIIIINLLTN